MHVATLGSMQDSRGIAAVELALVLPVFVMVMMATAEYGRAFYQYNTLTKAVRDGAQFLARTCLGGGGASGGTCNPTTAEKTAATNLVTYGSVTTGATLLVGCKDTAGGTSAAVAPTVTITAPVSNVYVTVSATCTYKQMFNAIPAITGTLTEPGALTASITMVGL